VSSGSLQFQLRVHDPLQADRLTPSRPSHPADMSERCQRPIQTDRHGHPPIGVASCPVGKIGVGWAYYAVGKALGIDVLSPQLALTA
jgi:hypothetical protein